MTRQECRVRFRLSSTIVFGCLFASGLLLCASPARAQWTQWGGPNRDFTVDTSGLAETWPEGGPKARWRRELGDGHASIVYDDGVLYTMYRPSSAAREEFTVALDAKTGKTIWEHGSPSLPEGNVEQYGFGPNSTPLVVDSRLYSVGSGAVLHCLDKRTGKVLWKHDLADEFGAPFPNEYGYSSSPIAYKNLVITPVGRRHSREEGGAHGTEPSGTPESAEGQSLMAFDQISGSLVWKRQDFRIDYSSPILIEFAGESHLVVVTRQTLVGLKPENGELLWSHTLSTGRTQHVMTPIAVGDDRIFCSCSESSVGSRLIKLTRKEGRTVPEELWRSRKMRIVQSNPVQIGDYIYGASGHNPSIIMGIDLKTGKRLWVHRGFEQAAFIHADGKLIFVDWNGQLVLATATPEGLTIHSQCQLTEQYSFVAPTLIGKTLYLRDQKHIMALEVG